MKMPFWLKRFGKSVRNLYIDPLPRDKWLVLSRIERRGALIDFFYEIDGIEYVNSVRIPESLIEPLAHNSSPAFDQLLTAIGLFLGAFFFRISDLKGIDVRCAPLDRESRLFFARFFQGGMGEFRFLQGLDPSRPIEIRAEEGVTVAPLQYDTQSSVLLCNGGGKDTVVSGELLKVAGIAVTWFSMQLNPARQRVIDLSGMTDSLDADFEIDMGIEQRLAYAWGHVPRTSIAGALALLVAILKRMPYVALGNECSANEGNVRYKGLAVNHQYVKTFEFEKGFADFVRRRVSVSTEVFSVLRPFHDLQLAGMLAERPEYFSAFVSCNRGIHEDKWCKACAKCAFTALAVGAYVGAEGLRQIFGEDILQRAEIRRHILDLLTDAVKPWECVGTRDESLTAIEMILRKDLARDFETFPRRADFEAVLAREDMAPIRDSVLCGSNPQHLIPRALLAQLNQGLKAFDRVQLSILEPRTGARA